MTGGKKAVQKLTSANTSKVYQSAVDNLQEAGVNLTTGQKLGAEGIKSYEQRLAGTPFSGSPLDNVLSDQHKQVQSALMKKSGFNKSDIEEGLINFDSIENAGKELSKRYKKALGEKTVTLSGKEFNERIDDIAEKNSKFIFSEKKAQKIADRMKSLPGEMTGKASINH